MNKSEMFDRTKRFAVAVIRLVGALPSRVESWVLGKQFLRSGTSIGANYREAQRSRSKQEFLSKIHICLQECEETDYWLELLAETFPQLNSTVMSLRAECGELIAIFVAIANKTNSTLNA